MNKSKLASEDLAVAEIQPVTGETFDRMVLKGEGPIAVEFMSYSCEHCRVMAPILQQVAEMVKSKEKIYKVNIVTEPELAQNYGVNATPTLIMFLGGKKVGQVVGPDPIVSSVLTAITHPFGPIK